MQNSTQDSLPLITKAFAETFIDTMTGQNIVQGIVTGIYTHLLFRTIILAAPRLRSGRHIYLVAILGVLYMLTILNLAATWAVTRSVVVTHNETLKSMAFAISNDNLEWADQLENISYYAAALLADMLLVWRCYTLWMKKKWILGSFGVLLLAELAFSVILSVSNFQVFVEQATALFIPLTPVFNFLSASITAIATLMIIFRILTVSRGSETRERYQYIIDTLIGSGMMYTLLTIIVGAMSVAGGSEDKVWAAATYVAGILVPVTGIAPTMIFQQVLTRSEESEEKWSQPISFMRFRHMTGMDNNTVANVYITLETSINNRDSEERGEDGLIANSEKVQHKSLPTYLTEADKAKCIRTVISI